MISGMTIGIGCYVQISVAAETLKIARQIFSSLFLLQLARRTCYSQVATQLTNYFLCVKVFISTLKTRKGYKENIQKQPATAIN